MKRLALLTAIALLIGFAVNANATSLLVNDSYFIGYIISGEPASQQWETAYTNYLITLDNSSSSLAHSITIGMQTETNDYFRSAYFDDPAALGSSYFKSPNSSLEIGDFNGGYIYGTDMVEVLRT